MTTEFKMPEPSITLVWADFDYGWEESTLDVCMRTECSSDRIVGHTADDMRAVIEHCAQICNYERVNIFGQSREGSLASCEEKIRKLLEQVK